MTKLEENNKYVKVSDCFNNPNDSRWKKFKRWASESMEKLPGFVQDVTGIDLNDPLKSLKEKFGGNKEKSKIPESDSKIVGNFVPSSNMLIGGLVGLSTLSMLAFFSPAVFLLVVPSIIGVVKIKGLISSDEGKEGTIHNPIRSGSKDYTQPGTKTITCNDEMITNNPNHASKIKGERNKGNVTSIRGRG
ncbi:hypothetical protein [Candidatus Mesenet endosymbiont of Agriotes lineatus]|uniref:hypothetical protein n=1 Tax=Candidatus Mesenet endosymbiont of Agriotes lineatus TaxID=3077948 RepID=UPI0030D46A08